MLSITLGRLYLSTRQPEPAVDVLSDMLDFEPRFADGHVLLARAHEALDQWDEAAAAYERAVLYSPRRARYRRQLANALATAGRADRAIEVLRGARPASGPRTPRAGTGWPGIELDAGDFDAAEAAARRVVELEPGDLRGAYLLSRALGGLRRYREMAEVLAPVVQRVRANGGDPRQAAGLQQQLALRPAERRRPRCAAAESLDRRPRARAVQPAGCRRSSFMSISTRAASTRRATSWPRFGDRGATIST